MIQYANCRVKFELCLAAGLTLLCWSAAARAQHVIARPGPAHGSARQSAAGKRAVKREHKPGRPVNPLAPFIYDIRPRHWDVGAPRPLVGRNPERITLAVIGKRFRPGASVLWNDQTLRTRFRSAERLEAVVPFDVMMAAKPRKPVTTQSGASASIGIRARNPAGGHGLSNAAQFEVVFVVVGG